MVNKHKSDIKNTEVQKKIEPCPKIEPAQFIKNFNKKILNHSYINNRMLFYLSDANQHTASSELKKLTSCQKLQIVKGNEKLDTMLSQVIASQNSRQTIGNTHNGLQPFTCIMT